MRFAPKPQCATGISVQNTPSLRANLEAAKDARGADKLQDQAPFGAGRR
jgi:hypothetical protein